MALFGACVATGNSMTSQADGVAFTTEMYVPEFLIVLLKR